MEGCGRGREPLAIGRVSQEFTRADGAAWLDDGRIVFTTGGTGLLELYVPSDGTRRVLHAEGSPAWPVYSRTGHILFEQRGAVWMLPFALDRLESTGAPTRLEADARHPSVAKDGTLLMLPGQQGVARRG